MNVLADAAGLSSVQVMSNLHARGRETHRIRYRLIYPFINLMISHLHRGVHTPSSSAQASMSGKSRFQNLRL